MPASTVWKVLRRHRINRLVWMDRPTGRIVRRYERDEPGELIHIDTKKVAKIPPGGGWWAWGKPMATPIRRGVDDVVWVAYETGHQGGSDPVTDLAAPVGAAGEGDDLTRDTSCGVVVAETAAPNPGPVETWISTASTAREMAYRRRRPRYGHGEIANPYRGRTRPSQDERLASDRGFAYRGDRRLWWRCR